MNSVMVINPVSYNPIQLLGGVKGNTSKQIQLRALTAARGRKRKAQEAKENANKPPIRIKIKLAPKKVETSEIEVKKEDIEDEETVNVTDSDTKLKLVASKCESSGDEDFVDAWKKKPKKKVKKRLNKVDSDFVVEEWKSEPSVRDSSDSDVNMNISRLKLKKKVRKILIESDDDFSDLPNIEIDAPVKESQDKEVDESSLIKVEESSQIQVAESAVEMPVIKDEILDSKLDRNDTVAETVKKMIEKKDADDSSKASEKKTSDIKTKKRKSSGSSDDDKSSSDSKKLKIKSDTSESKNSKKNKEIKIERPSKDNKESSNKSSKNKSADKDRDLGDKRKEKLDKIKEKYSNSSKERSSKDKSKPSEETTKLNSKFGSFKIPKKSQAPASFLDALGSVDESLPKNPPVKVKSSGFRSIGVVESSTKSSTVVGKKVPAQDQSSKSKNVTSTSSSSTKTLTSSSSSTKTATSTSSSSSTALKRPNDDPDFKPVFERRSSDDQSSNTKKLKLGSFSHHSTSDRPGGVKLTSPKRREYFNSETIISFITNLYMLAVDIKFDFIVYTPHKKLPCESAHDLHKKSCNADHVSKTFLQIVLVSLLSTLGDANLNQAV